MRVEYGTWLFAVTFTSAAFGCSKSDPERTRALEPALTRAPLGMTNADILVDAGPRNPLTCGRNTPCTGTDVCCATPGATGVFAYACAPSCTAGAFTLACDGPGQCGAGAPYCCGQLQVGPEPSCTYLSASTSCAAACTTALSSACPSIQQVRMCRKSADCAGEPTGATHCCRFNGPKASAVFCADAAMKTKAAYCDDVDGG